MGQGHQVDGCFDVVSEGEKYALSVFVYPVFLLVNAARLVSFACVNVINLMVISVSWFGFSSLLLIASWCYGCGSCLCKI